MLENHLLQIACKLRHEFYKDVFSRTYENNSPMSAVDLFSLEIIHALDHPTISDFADFIGISRPAASYKIASLIQKGYITKEVSATDKREYRIAPSEKYMMYLNMYEEKFKSAVLEEEKNYSEEEILSAKSLLEKMGTAL